MTYHIPVVLISSSIYRRSLLKYLFTSGNMILMSCFVLVIAFMTLGFVNSDGDGNWGYQTGNYKSPSDWKDRYKSCGGNRQSPINIKTENVEYWSGLKPVMISGQNSPAQVSLMKSDMTVYLSFGNMWKINFNGVGCYQPVAIHWHWGSKDIQGSEHTLNDVKYPIEGHLVTYNCQLYNNASDATISPSGLHVFGILYQMGAANPVIESLETYLKKVKTGGSVMIPEMSPDRFLPTNLANYYRYEGSLTTPPCTENVIWTVFNEIQTINSPQLELFRSLMYGKPESGPMVDNFRPVSPIIPSPDYVRRVIYKSFNGATTHVFQWLFVSVPILVATSFI